MAVRRRTLALLAGTFLAASCSTPVSPAPSATSTLASTAAPSPSEVAVVSPSPAPLPTLPAESAAHLAWTKAKTNLPPRVAHGGIHLAVPSVGASRYVGVDAFWEVWTSNDGASWIIATKKPSGVPSAWTVGLEPLGNQLVAFDRNVDYLSADLDGYPYSRLSDGQTWLTTNSLDWSSHPGPFAFTDGIVDGTRLVATGGLKDDRLPSFATSPDGSTWSVIPQANQQWPISAGCSLYTSGLAGSSADGYIIAATRISPGGTSCPAPTSLLWRSTDLGAWQPVSIAAGSCVRAYDVIHGPRGFVAVGASPGSSGGAVTSCAWASRDGITWTAAANPPPVVTSGVRQLAIAPDGTFLAYGDEIWESTDGLQWYRSTPATNVYIYEIAGDLAVGCGTDTCDSLRMSAP